MASLSVIFEKIALFAETLFSSNWATTPFSPIILSLTSSKLFSHKVTVVDENGRIYYLSNEIFGDKELDLWWHADRLSDEEWNEYYKGD